MTRAKVDLARKKILFLALHSLRYIYQRKPSEEKRRRREKRADKKPGWPSLCSFFVFLSKSMDETP